MGQEAVHCSYPETYAWKPSKTQAEQEKIIVQQ